MRLHFTLFFYGLSSCIDNGKYGEFGNFITRFAFDLKIIRDAFKKKIAEKETLVHMGGRGVTKIPFF